MSTLSPWRRGSETDLLVARGTLGTGVKVRTGSCGTSDSGTDSDYVDEEGVKNQVEDGAEKQVEKQVENEQQASITKAKTVEAEITDKPDPAEKEDGALSDIQGVSEVKLLEIEIHARLDKMDQDMANCLKTLSTVAGINKQDEQDDKQGTAEGRVKPRTSEIDKDHIKVSRDQQHLKVGRST